MASNLLKKVGLFLSVIGTSVLLTGCGQQANVSPSQVSLKVENNQEYRIAQTNLKILKNQQTNLFGGRKIPNPADSDISTSKDLNYITYSEELGTLSQKSYSNPQTMLPVQQNFMIFLYQQGKLNQQGMDNTKGLREQKILTNYYRNINTWLTTSYNNVNHIDSQLGNKKFEGMAFNTYLLSGNSKLSANQLKALAMTNKLLIHKLEFYAPVKNN